MRHQQGAKGAKSLPNTLLALLALFHMGTSNKPQTNPVSELPPVGECLASEDWRRVNPMASEYLEAAYAAAWLLERQDALQAGEPSRRPARPPGDAGTTRTLRAAGQLGLRADGVAGPRPRRFPRASDSRRGLGDNAAAGRPLAHHPAGVPQRNRAARSPELQGYGRYYFVAHHETEAGDEWKIDVSLWTPEAAPVPLAHAQGLRRRLIPETRLAILWIKDVWHRMPSYPDVVSGMDVYEAVLEHGVRTPEQFGRHLRGRGLPASYADARSGAVIWRLL
jgi:hypothetical protein